MTWLHGLKSTPDLRFWWYGKGEKAKKAAQPAHNSICAVSTTNIWFIPLTTRSSRSCQHLSLYSKSSVQRFFSLFLMSCVVSLGDLFKAPLQSKICFSSFPYTCSCTPTSEIPCVKLQYVCSEFVTRTDAKISTCLQRICVHYLNLWKWKKSLHILIFSFITLRENEHCYFLVKNMSFKKNVSLISAWQRLNYVISTSILIKLQI